MRFLVKGWLEFLVILDFALGLPFLIAGCLTTFAREWYCAGIGLHSYLGELRDRCGDEVSPPAGSQKHHLRRILSCWRMRPLSLTEGGRRRVRRMMGLDKK